MARIMIERIPTRCLVDYRRWRKRTAGHSSRGVAPGYSDHRRWRTNPWPKAIFNASREGKAPEGFLAKAIFNIARGIALESERQQACLAKWLIQSISLSDVMNAITTQGAASNQ